MIVQAPLSFRFSTIMVVGLALELPEMIGQLKLYFHRHPLPDPLPPVRRDVRVRDAAHPRPPPHGGLRPLLRHLHLRAQEAHPPGQEPAGRHLLLVQPAGVDGGGVVARGGLLRGALAHGVARTRAGGVGGGVDRVFATGGEVLSLSHAKPVATGTFLQCKG